MRVAVAQMEPKLAEKERNLDACLARLEEAAAAGAELLVLPGVRDPGLHVRQRARRRCRTRRRSRGPRPRRSSASAARLGVHASAGCSSATATRSTTRPILVGPDGPDRHLPEDAPALPRRRPLRHAGRRAEGLRHPARPDRPDHLLRPPLPGGDADARAARRRHRRPADELPDGGEGADRADHARAAPRRTGSTSCARTASARSGRASSAAGARSSTRSASGWQRRARPRRRCSSPRSTSRRPGTRTTWFPVSTSSTSSATDGRSSTAPSSRRRRPSRPKEDPDGRTTRSSSPTRS